MDCGTPARDRGGEQRMSLIAYYKFSEPAETTQANDSSGTQAPPMRPWRYPDQPGGSASTAVFGAAEGVTTDSLTALQLASTSGGYSAALRADAAPVALKGLGVFVSAAGAEGGIVFGDQDLSNGLTVEWDNFFAEITVNRGVLNLCTAPAPTDGAVHHVFVRQNGATVELYLDGALVASAAGALGTVGPYFVGPAQGFPFTMTICHLALFDADIGSARIAEIAAAGLTGFAGETTDARLRRYADMAGIPSDEIVTSTSRITAAHIDSTEQGVLELMRKVETTEAGVLHDDRAGRLTLRNRDDRYQAPVAVTLNAASQDVGIDFAPTVDGQSQYNIADGRNIDGTVAATYSDEASRDEYGEHAYSVETAATDPGEPYQLIAAVVNANSEPRPRVPSITIAMSALDTTTMQAVAGLDIGDKVRLINMPTQTPGGSTVDFFVEGYAEKFTRRAGEDPWQITLNLSPAWPLDSLFVLDDPVHGVLDAGNLLAL
ncbi:hypothetical protein [Nocardioides sp. MH1]|uniref:hypothetical protein n=1 Tax=Nocardioides sp. MH1 TaxID=3242490 RepID=UPI0035204986